MTRLLVILLGIVILSGPVAAQEAKDEKPNFAEPKKDWKWEEDKRFDFLMERLASLEASLDAVNNAIAKASGKKGAKRGDARRAEAGNSAMDRKGGGPMKWNEFYGTTAEKFFYHPVDPNTTYHTSTVLSQVGTQQEDRAGESVQGNSGIPVHQRPPQFDYIYRANRDAKERAEAEAAEIQGKLDALNERREKLEAEQAELWCRIAFRAIQRSNIPQRPDLRFRLVAAPAQPEESGHVAALEAAARFLGYALMIIDKAEADQALALGGTHLVVAAARSELGDALTLASVSDSDQADLTHPLGQFVRLAQLLEDTSRNLSESYEVAVEGDRSKDTGRKSQFRGLLQRSLLEYAEILLALDECFQIARSQWGVTVDPKQPGRQYSLLSLPADYGSPYEKERLVRALTSRVWYQHWENESKDVPLRFTTNGEVLVRDPSASEKWHRSDKGNQMQTWTIERRWVINAGGTFFIPIDGNRFRGTFVPSPRVVGLIADPVE
jgi:hypothetical protein